MKKLVFLIGLIAVLASCRSTRTISNAVTKKDSAVKAVPAVAVVDTQQLIQEALQQVRANRIDYQTFNAKVAIDYKGTDGKGYGVNANIKMYKDSAIWVSANAILGIEAMRVLVTKDSVKLLNKLEKVYTARSIEYLQEVTSLPLNLYTLQDMIIGNPVYLDSNIVQYSNGNGVISLMSLGEFFRNLVLLNETDKRIIQSKLDDTNPLHSRTADLWYSDYETKKGPLFATRREIAVSGKGRLEIKLDYKNYAFDEPVEFPFSIPKNYQRN